MLVTEENPVSIKALICWLDGEVYYHDLVKGWDGDRPCSERENEEYRLHTRSMQRLIQLRRIVLADPERKAQMEES